MSNFCLIVAITCILGVGLNIANAKFPVDPQPCKYGDSECITNIIEYFLHEKNQGDSSINLIKLDPLLVKKLRIKQGAESPVNIDLLLRNNSIHGLSNTKIVNVQGFGKDMTKKHEVTFRVGHLSLVGDYTINGNILILPIVGSGLSNISLINCDMIVKFTGAPYEKDGDSYMKIDKFYFDVVPNRLIFKIDNLFNGDKALGDNMNLFLNQNWEDIFREVKVSITSAFGKIFQSVINNVFTKYPYNKFFND